MVQCCKLLLGALGLFSVVRSQVPEPTQQPTPSVWSEATKNMYPSPRSNPKGCNRADKSYICDPNKKMLSSDLDDVNTALMGLRFDTTGGCPCTAEGKNCDYKGMPVMVTIMNNFSYSSNDDLLALMKSYGIQFKENWNFFDCPDDCMVFVIGVESSIKVYRHYCNLGTNTTEITITSDKCRAYVASQSDEMFASGNIIGGLKEDLKNYRLIYEGRTTCEPSGEIMFVAIIIIVIIVLVIIAIIIAVIFIKKRQKQRPIPPANTRETEQLKPKSTGNVTA